LRDRHIGRSFNNLQSLPDRLAADKIAGRESHQRHEIMTSLPCEFEDEDEDIHSFVL
jgi:hypothetical protein